MGASGEQISEGRRTIAKRRVGECGHLVYNAWLMVFNVLLIVYNGEGGEQHWLRKAAGRPQQRATTSSTQPASGHRSHTPSSWQEPSKNSTRQEAVRSSMFLMGHNALVMVYNTLWRVYNALAMVHNVLLVQ